MAHRSARDRRRRSLAQNFLRDKRLANDLAALAGPDDLVLEFGAGRGALTIPLAESGARVIALERDPVWARRLRDELVARELSGRVRIKTVDMLRVRLPRETYRVISSPPFNLTTALLHLLLDDPSTGPYRADLIVQKEVARKRSAMPPTNLLSTVWAPWWNFELVRTVPREAFRPVPSVDAAWLTITPRHPPLLPPRLAGPYANFVRSTWATGTQREARPQGEGPGLLGEL